MVRAGVAPRVRVDVRDLARRWLRRGPDEFGVAIEAEGPGRAGVTVALVPTSGAAERDGRTAYAGPRLELYVK